MIWVGGRIVPDDALRVSVLDRTFEHGLGLFETFRTWGGRPTLLPRHLERLARSARELGLPLDPATLPDREAVRELIRADGREGDALLRITLSGGLSEGGGSVVWMRAKPLPPPPTEDGAFILRTWNIEPGDPLARYKSLNYWRRRLAYEEARSHGEDESLSRTGDGHLWEGSRTNLFLVQGDRLVTPPASGPIVPGIMRGLVLERARLLGLRAEEEDVPSDVFATVVEAFLTNSVRGIIPVRQICTWHSRETPGPATRRLRDDVRAWLESESAGS